MANGSTSGTDAAIGFRPYRLIPPRRLLLKDETPVPLGSRAIDLLVALASRAGELVTKEELFAAAWPDQIVEEVNLRAQIAVIRRTLGDGQSGRRYLTTI